MKKVLLLICITWVIHTTKTFAQCCGEKIRFDEWLYESCESSNQAFQTLANNLPEGQACYAKVGRVFYVAFKDIKGQRHLGVASEENHETFKVSAFHDSSATKIFSAIFMLNGLDENLKLLFYEEEDTYVRVAAPFKNFKEYWEMYFTPQIPNHQ
ncbi:MAG: hypothetical protein KBC98_00540 [Candidatus Pacebacteria bacterium]|nr:hypothetical protein [Candidatus Paceibacterota bacterium]